MMEIKPEESKGTMTFRVAMLYAGLLGLAACGGGGGSGSSEPAFNESPATIASTEQAEGAAEATRQGASQAISEDQAADSIPLGASISSFSNEELVRSHSLDLVEVANLPAGATTVVEGECGGSANITSNGSNHVTIVYNDYCLSIDGFDYVLNGTYDITYTLSGETITSFSADYDVTATYRGETYSSSGSISCQGESLTDCTVVSDFNGTNGRSYRITNLTVSGDEVNGYNVSARVYDGDVGYVDFQATGLVPCDGGGFSSGTIEFSDSNGGTVTVVFSGCGAYTVTYDGVATLVSQG